MLTIEDYEKFKEARSQSKVYDVKSLLSVGETMQFYEKQAVSDRAANLAKSFFNGVFSQGVGGVLHGLQWQREVNQHQAGEIPDVITDDDDMDVVIAKQQGGPSALLDAAANAQFLKPYEVRADSGAERLAYDITQGAGQLAFQAAVSLLPGGQVLSPGAMALQIGGEEYKELRSQGVDIDTADAAATINAAVQTPLESLGLSRLMRKIPANSLLRQRVRHSVENILTEGLTEALQEYPEQASAIWARAHAGEPPKDFGTIAKEVAQTAIEHFDEITPDALYSGFIGGVLGGGATGLHLALDNNLKRAMQREAHNTMMEHAEASVERIKESRINPPYAAAVINENMQGQSVYVDGEALLGYAQEAGVEKVAESLGVTVEDIEKAALESDTVDVKLGNFEATGAAFDGFIEAVKNDTAFEDGGYTVNQEKREQEMARKYQEQEHEIRVEKDRIAGEMKAAGVSNETIVNTLALATARAMNTNDPIGLLRKMQFRVGSAKSPIGQLKRAIETPSNQGTSFSLDSDILDVNGQIPENGTPFIDNPVYKEEFADEDNLDAGKRRKRQGAAKNHVLSAIHYLTGKGHDTFELRNMSPASNTLMQRLEQEGYVQALNEWQEGGNVTYRIRQENLEQSLFQEAVNSQIEKVRQQYQGTDQYMKAPNGADTNLNEEQWCIVRTPAFLAWFGDWINDPASASKVLDENGEPLVVYHGSKKKFDAFAKEKIGSGTSKKKGNHFGAGFYFTPTYFDAQAHGKNIYEVFLSIKNPASSESGVTAENDGIIALGFNGREYIAFNPTQVKSATENNGNFDANDPNIYHQANGTVKGGFNPDTNIITLFKGADASTVIHETWHYFIEQMWQSIQDGSASEQTVKDFDKLLNYAGMTREAWEKADMNGRRAAHERLAEAGETYIMEGKAPSYDLRRVFRNFARWLQNVYRTIQRNSNAVPLTDEVREVFDRMLAAEDDIARMEKVNGYFAKLPDAITENLSDATRARVEDYIAKARDKAVEVLTRRALRNYTKQRREDIKTIRAELLPKVEKEIDGRRVYQTGVDKKAARRYRALKEKEAARGTPEPFINRAFRNTEKNDVANLAAVMNPSDWQAGLKTVRADYVRQADALKKTGEQLADIEKHIQAADAIQAKLAEVEKKYRDKLKNGGTPLNDTEAGFVLQTDLTAEQYGYSSTDEMLKDVENSPSKREAVTQRLNELMRELTDGEDRESYEDSVREAIYNGDEALLIGVEQQLIENFTKQAQAQQISADIAAARRQQARNAAKADLANMNIKDAVRTNKFITAERNAAVKSAQLLAKKDFDGALAQKNLQAYWHAMAAESMKVKKRKTQYDRYLKTQVKKKPDAWLNETHFGAISQLFVRMGVARDAHIVAAADAKFPSLAAYTAAMEEQFDCVDIADWILSEGVAINDTNTLTLEQYEDVVNAVKNIQSIVKAQKGANTFQKHESFQAFKVSAMKQLGNLKTIFTPSPNKPTRASATERWIASMETTDTLFEMLDNATFGFFSKNWGEALKHSADHEYECLDKYNKADADALRKWLPDKAAEKAAGEEVFYDELQASVTKHVLVKMLINLGNKDNSQRLCETVPVGFENSKIWLKPDEFTTREEAAEATRQNLIGFLGRVLTKEDVEYAQRKIDAAEMFWGEKNELEKRVKGFGLKKVEATPVELTIGDKTVVLRGGYFPLMRNGETGSHAASQEVADDDPLQGKRIRTYHTNTSSSKARTKARYPVNLFPGAETQWIYESIHDLCWRETMSDFRRVLNDQELFAMLKSKIGVARMNVFKELLEVAADPKNSKSLSEGERMMGDAVSWLRQRTSHAVIMMNFKVIMQNYANAFLYGNAVQGYTMADNLRALGTYMLKYHFPGTHKELVDFVFSRSAYMRERCELPDITVRDIVDEKKEFAWEKASREIGIKAMALTDNATAVPNWIEAYNKKLNAGATEQEAVDFADTIVRRVLGSSRITDVASMQRGGPIMKVMTMFQSFFNARFNEFLRMERLASKQWTKGEKQAAFANVFSYVISKWLGQTMFAMALALQNPFGIDDKDDYPELLKELKSYSFSMMGPIGQVGSYLLGLAAGMHEYNYRMSAIESTVDKIGRAAAKVGSDKASMQDKAEGVVDTASMLVGVPAQINRVFWNLFDMAVNDMAPEWGDIYRRRPKRER